MFQWRVTKYNPTLRKEAGAYPSDEWTSVSDIGKEFKGKILDIKEYQSMEDRYVLAAIHFFKESGLTYLAALNIEYHPDLTDELSKLESVELISKYEDMREGQRLSISEVSDVCRLNLRELVWCKLEASGKFFLHFGYDFYMYIGSTYLCVQSIDYANRIGLFVEEYQSPYFD